MLSKRLLTIDLILYKIYQMKESVQHVPEGGRIVKSKNCYC
jgi:hypothetical protein